VGKIRKFRKKKEKPKKEKQTDLKIKGFFVFNFVPWKLWHNFPNVFQIYTKKYIKFWQIFFLPSGEILSKRKTLAWFPFFLKYVT
jgi:hypothetical protein